MKKNHHRVLSRFISQVKNSVKIYAGEYLDTELIEECKRYVSRKIAVEIYISNTIVEKVESLPFVLNKLYQLRDLGASIYDVSDFDTAISFICQVDFETTLLIPLPDDGSILYVKKGEAIFNVNKKIFDTIDQEREEFRAEQDDISLWLKVDSPNVIEGAATMIHWNSSNVNVVEIDGLGKVENSGTQSLRILEDTILNIRAANENQVKIRSLSINTIKRLAIDYDVQFLNPASKQFVSLMEESSTGVFGVTQGNKIKLIWNMEEADEVEIAPFNITQKVGEHVFQVESAIEINLQATLQGTSKKKRIIIHEFPMPVFNHKLVVIEDKFLPHMEFKMNDLREQAFNYLERKGYASDNTLINEVKAKIQFQEQVLLSIYNQTSFQKFYENHSIPKLDKYIKTRLRSYFNEQKTVSSMINSLRNYYE